MHTLVKQILLLSPDQQIDLIGEIFGSEFNVEIVRKLPDVASLEKTFQDNPYLIVVAGEGSEPGIVEAFLDESEDSSLKVLLDRKSTRLNSSHSQQSRMPSSA